MSGLLPRRRPSESDDARVLPLINVVFLLLVFFMVAGRLDPAPPFEVAPLRAASGAPETRVDAAPPSVLIGPDGALALDGERIAQDALLALIETRAQAPGGLPILQLQADARADTLEVATLMRALQRRGVGSFRLLVEPASSDPTP